VINAPEVAQSVLGEARVLAGQAHFDDPTFCTPDQKLQKMSETAPLPSPSELASVIEHVFWASLLTEERRPTRIRLSLPTPKVEVHGSGPGAGIVFIRLASDESLSAANLRRLCQVYDPESSFVSLSFVDHVPVLRGIGALISRDTVPEFFTILSFRPGVLDFSWSNARLARFAQGQLAVLSQATGLAALMEDWVQSVFDNTRVQLVLSVATKSIAEHGHGGSLWLANDASESLGCAIGYRSVPAPPLVQRFPEVEMCHAYGRAIGRLSGIDGAVVLSGDSNLIGFGAFIDLDQALRVERIRGDGSTEVVPVEEVGGGRHRSAVTFCARHVPSMAIVHSEDGAVTLVRHRPERDVCEIIRFGRLGLQSAAAL